MRISKENLPVAMEAPGIVMRSKSELGGMTVAYS